MCKSHQIISIFSSTLYQFWQRLACVCLFFLHINPRRCGRKLEGSNCVKIEDPVRAHVECYSWIVCFGSSLDPCALDHSDLTQLTLLLLLVLVPWLSPYGTMSMRLTHEVYLKMDWRVSLPSALILSFLNLTAILYLVLWIRLRSESTQKLI